MMQYIIIYTVTTLYDNDTRRSSLHYNTMPYNTKTSWKLNFTLIKTDFLLFVDALIEAIHNDIKIAKEQLLKPENQIYSSHSFLTDKTIAPKNEVILG